LFSILLTRVIATSQQSLTLTAQSGLHLISGDLKFSKLTLSKLILFALSPSIKGMLSYPSLADILQSLNVTAIGSSGQPLKFEGFITP
jgi:hypothetical protein